MDTVGVKSLLGVGSFFNKRAQSERKTAYPT
jgi:hypothetical protein